MTPEEAKAAYAKMAPEEQARVTMLVKQGKKGREAVANVLDQVEAYENEQPSTAENVGAGALAVANSAGLNLADEARGAANAIGESVKGTFRLKPATFDELGGAYREGRDSQRQAVDDAQSIAPSASGWGEVASIPLGALIPGSAATKAPTIGRAALQAGKAGAGMGAVGGFGAGEGAADSGIKGALGALLGGGLGAATGGGAAALGALRGKAPSLPSGGVSAVREKIGGVVNALDEKVPEGVQDVVPGMRLLRRMGKALGTEPPAPPEPPGPYPSIDWQPASQSNSAQAPAGAADDLVAAWREMIKPKPMQMPEDVMVGGMPPKPAPAPSAPPPSPVAPPPAPSPAKPPPGVTFSDPTIDPHAMADAPVWNAVDDTARQAFMAAVSKMPLAPPPQAAQPMTDAALRAAVEPLVKQGVPLRLIAEQLGVNQGDIVQIVRGAQFSQPL